MYQLSGCLEKIARRAVFNCRRHLLAHRMQAKGVPTTHAQVVMRHASGTITFDTYGFGVPVGTIAELLKDLFNAGFRWFM